MKKRLRKMAVDALFPKTSLEKESIQRLAQAKIGDGGYAATGDISREAKLENLAFSYEDKADFLKRCGIEPERFLGRQ